MAQDRQQSATDGPRRTNPAAMAPVDAARMLSAVGGVRVDVASIAADVEAGAPANADGTINLVHYAAWLVKELESGGE